MNIFGNSFLARNLREISINVAVDMSGVSSKCTNPIIARINYNIYDIFIPEPFM